jgi:hypothetical protein
MTWGPFGLGKWNGHAKVFCGVCGWPQYHMWIDQQEPPGDCPDGHSIAKACPRVLDVLMRNAWVRACMGKDEVQPPIEMLRLVTGLSWDEIERMTDASGNSSSKIADMKKSALPSTE